MVIDCDVIVIGAGLAGLNCARRLAASGLDVLVLEASDGIGGRVPTDEVHGFRLDRGFQVLLTAYPEAQESLDYGELELRPFYAGALIRCNGAFHRLADPWRHPWDAFRGVLAPIGGVRDKLRSARLRRRVLTTELSAMFASPDVSAAEFLCDFGLSPEVIQRFFRPFFGGVFLESELQTSCRMLQFVFRMFAAGPAALPAEGMEAIPPFKARWLLAAGQLSGFWWTAHRSYFHRKSFQKGLFRLGAFPERAGAEAWCIHIESLSLEAVSPG